LDIFGGVGLLGLLLTFAHEFGSSLDSGRLVFSECLRLELIVGGLLETGAVGDPADADTVGLVLDWLVGLDAEPILDLLGDALEDLLLGQTVVALELLDFP